MNIADTISGDPWYFVMQFTRPKDSYQYCCKSWNWQGAVEVWIIVNVSKIGDFHLQNSIEIENQKEPLYEEKYLGYIEIEKDH